MTTFPDNEGSISNSGNLLVVIDDNEQILPRWEATCKVHRDFSPWGSWKWRVCALGSRFGMGCSCVLSHPLACLFLGTTPFPLSVVLF